MKQPHIQLDENVNAKCALLPGDPARVSSIARYLQNPRELVYNREYRSLIGTYKEMPILAISTGMGGSSTSIAVEELHHIGLDSLIRIGSCGALQKGIGLGDLVIGCGAIRDDGASKAYVKEIYPAVPDPFLLNDVIQSAKDFGYAHHVGIIHSHETFYTDTNEAEEAEWAALGVLGSDFESAALFTVGRIRGMHTASILNNVVLSDADSADSVGNYQSGIDLTKKGEEHEILTALEALYRFQNEK